MVCSAIEPPSVQPTVSLSAGSSATRRPSCPDLKFRPRNPGAGHAQAAAVSLIGKLDPKTPLILATTVGEIEYVEWAILNHRPDLALQSRPQVLLGRIKNLLGLVGPATVISSACASSAIALARAAAAIRRGDAKKVLVVTCDSISEFVYSGFSTLLSLCDEPAQSFRRRAQRLDPW